MNRKSTVYSTDQGRHCPVCNQPLQKCQCKQGHKTPASDGIVRLQRQTKGRNGKPVTLITGLGLEPKALKALAKTLKSQCGTGGSVDADNILIQGDKRDVIKPLLESKGYVVKLSGG